MTPQELAAMIARAEAEATIRDRATAALDTDRAYLAIATPSNAQMAAHLKELTRQNIGLIRLVLGQLDATD